MEDISIHALLAESDKLAHRWAAWYCLFLSTLSLRRATKHLENRAQDLAFLSTLSLRRATGPMKKGQVYYINFYPRSPCGERPVTRVASTPTTAISIHALLAESDNARPETRQPCAISIHALLAESDMMILQALFQPHYFYPRSPCGERPEAINPS